MQLIWLCSQPKKMTWTPGGLRKITWTPADSTWNMWGKVKSSFTVPQNKGKSRRHLHIYIHLAYNVGTREKESCPEDSWSEKATEKDETTYEVCPWHLFRPIKK